MSDELTALADALGRIKSASFLTENRETLEKSASAIRSYAAAQEQEPVGYGYSAEIQSAPGDFLHVCREKKAMYDTPLYLSPPPAAGWDITEDMVRAGARAMADLEDVGIDPLIIEHSKACLEAARDYLRRNAPPDTGAGKKLGPQFDVSQDEPDPIMDSDGVPDHGGADAGVVWRSISEDTRWIDGRDVVLLANDMEVQARYCPGEWCDETPSSPREYSGAVWSCFDDQFQLEIEECSEDPSEWCHDGATHWRPISAISKPAPVAGNEDDPSMDERWQAGLDFAMIQLCTVMGVDPHDVTWDAATEETEGDVRAIIWNILRAKMGEDWKPAPVAANASAEARLRERVNELEQMCINREEFIAQNNLWKEFSAYLAEPHASDCDKHGCMGDMAPGDPKDLAELLAKPSVLEPSDRPADVTVDDLSKFICREIPICIHSRVGDFLARALLDAFTVGRR